MKLAVCVAVLVFVIVGMASATPVCSSGTTLADLIALGSGGCVYDSNNVLFSNFSVKTEANADVNNPDASTILVDFTGAGPNQVGITFFAPWGTCGPNCYNSVNQWIDFQVQALTEAYWFKGASLAVTGDSNRDDNSNKVMEKANNQVFTALVTTDTIPVSKAFLAFSSPVETLVIEKQIKLHNGHGDQTTISEVAQLYGVPEPASYLLIGAGLIGLALLRRKR